MSERRLSVADVMRSGQTEFLARYSTSAQQRKALRDITACRTAVLGGHVQRCDRCGHQEIAYNSCRNRHCPQCQGGRQAEWLEARARELLPVPYFHVVFTLPQPLAPLALQNPRTVYGLLFRVASQTLQTIAADPRHLGARLGFLAVLHTWGQTLTHHPHLHCLVPGGGLSEDDSRWVPSRSQFFLPVRVLSRLFRRLFLELLERASDAGELTFSGRLEPLADPPAWQSFRTRLHEQEWNVYCKPPFAGPERVLAYLARYTHRVALSNRRLLWLRNGWVSFRAKDYRRGGAPRTVTLEAPEFVRRFLLHVLPKGFVRIRSFGFLSHRFRKAKLALCRQLMAFPAPQQTPSIAPAAEAGFPTCPLCRQGRMLRTETLPPSRLLPLERTRPP